MAAVPELGRATQVEPRVAPEAAATQDLYERYAGPIFGFCLHQLGNREEAEDAVQQTFLNAFRGLRRGVSPEAESAWLYKIAHNVCLTRRRSSYRRGRVESPGDMQVLQEFVAAPQRMGTDELIQLQEALAGMPTNQRKAILLREWQGLSYREIADEMELSQAAVETLIFRARRSLAQGLEESPTEKRGWRRLRHAMDAGTVVGALKALFAGSAAVKAAATAVAVGTAGLAVVSAPGEGHRRPTPSVDAPAAKVQRAEQAPASAPVSVSRAHSGTVLVAPVAATAAARDSDEAGRKAGPRAKRPAPAATDSAPKPASGPEETPSAAPGDPAPTPASTPTFTPSAPAPSDKPATPKPESRPQAQPASSPEAGGGNGDKDKDKGGKASAVQPAAAPAPASEEKEKGDRDRGDKEKGKGKASDADSAARAPQALVSNSVAEVTAPAAQPEEKKGNGKGEERKQEEKAQAPSFEPPKIEAAKADIGKVEAAAPDKPSKEERAEDKADKGDKGGGKGRDK